MSADDLAMIADASAAAGDWGSLRIYAMELTARPSNAGGSEGYRLKAAKESVAKLIVEVELPADQERCLEKIDEIELFGENGQKIYYDAVGVRDYSLRGSVPKIDKPKKPSVVRVN